MNQLLERPSLPDCSIAIKCADDPLIERCLDSIDDPSVAVNAVITRSRRIEELLQERGVPYTFTSYGNIARSAQLSVDEAVYDNVIVMDSDAYFQPGAIGALRQALTTAVVAKPRLEFLDNGTRRSKAIAESRRQYNAVPNLATNPGLALRRRELAEKCGYIFNPLIRWTEDADLNYRMSVNDVQIAYVSEAVVYHDPVSLRHELKCAFLYGVGKRLSIEHTEGRVPTEELTMIVGGLLKAAGYKNVARILKEDSAERAILAAAWRVLYLSGYHAQKQTGRWSVA